MHAKIDTYIQSSFSGISTTCETDEELLDGAKNPTDHSSGEIETNRQRQGQGYLTICMSWSSL